MSALTEFLTARFDEDEAKARAATPGPWTTTTAHEWTTPFDGELLVRTGDGRDYWEALITPAGGEHGDDGLRAPDAEHIVRHDPARVLADIAAKRQIVELRYSWNLQAERAPEPPFGPILKTQVVTADTILRTLAAVYADHSDFREEWRA